MQNKVDDLLRLMLESPSPSGSETSVTNSFSEFMKEFVDEVYSDSMGNVIAHKKKTGAKSLMLISHADEVGFMITHIDNRGFLYFQPVGGIDVNLLPGLQVEIHDARGKIIGVIGRKPKHLQKKEDANQQIRFEDLWIDIGAKDKTDAESYVHIGDYATYKASVTKQLNNLITSKSLDDKIGLAVIAEVATRLHHQDVKYDLYFVASTQEELGTRGATIVANKIKTDKCIAIDVTHATDYPHMTPFRSGEIKLGNGAVIAIGPNINQELSTTMENIAQSNGICYQLEAIPFPTGTDARQIQISGTGVLTALVSIPCRYMHSPVEIVSIDDVNSAVEIITGYCLNKERKEE